MLKRDEGYGHAIKLTFNTANVTSKSGTITGRMNCYIPISKVKFLFEEKKNEHEKNILFVCRFINASNLFAGSNCYVKEFQ